MRITLEQMRQMTMGSMRLRAMERKELTPDPSRWAGGEMKPLL
jgi:hypothetical protein